MVARYPDYRPARVVRARRSRVSALLIRSALETIMEAFVSSCRYGKN
jgi:hypothetical protein